MFPQSHGWLIKAVSSHPKVYNNSLAHSSSSAHFPSNQAPSSGSDMLRGNFFISSAMPWLHLSPRYTSVQSSSCFVSIPVGVVSSRLTPPHIHRTWRLTEWFDDDDDDDIVNHMLLPSPSWSQVLAIVASRHLWHKRSQIGSYGIMKFPLHLLEDMHYLYSMDFRFCL